jgi:ABC-type antimicrobial peptide transport system permease subunit
MKFNSSISKILTNKWFLNIVAFLAIFNIIGYAARGNLIAILYFILFSCLVRYFSKNMTIVLGVPLIIVNLLSLGGNMVEGMDNNDTSTTDTSATDNSAKKKIEEDKKSNAPDAVSGQVLSMSSVDDAKPKDDNAAQNTGGEQQGFESGRRKNRGYNIDYATTVEDAYDELNNTLGSEGIQRLTADTQNLMKQQAQLAKTMEGMSKLVENIQPMIGKLEQIMSSSKEERD